MASELELLLQAYQGQGELDSTGSFTVDPEKLRQKLSRFLLPEPHAYILKLIQWAVACQATRIKVEVGRRDVLLAHNGSSTDHNAAADWGFFLESHWQEDGWRTPEVELATALNALYQLSPARVVLLQHDGFQATVLEVGKEGTRQTMERGRKSSHLNLIKIEGRRPTYGSRLAAQQHRPLTAAFLAKVAAGFRANVPLAEKALLEACCLYCPVPLTVNGECINRPVFALTEKEWPPIFGKKPSRFSLVFSEVRDLSEKGLLYRLSRSSEPELLAPAFHPGCSLSSWYCPEARDSVVESRSANSFAVKGLLSWMVSNKITVQKTAPVNADTLTLFNPRLIAKGATVSGVVRGVCVETDYEPFLPNDSQTVLTDSALGTDLSGLRVRRGKQRNERLREWAGQVEAMLRRRRV